MFIMETMERKQPRRRRSFTPEFKAGIVERCRAGDRTIGQVTVARKGEAPSQIAKDFGISESCLHRWLQLADIDHHVRPDVTSSESAEFRELRKRTRRRSRRRDRAAGGGVLRPRNRPK
jgi:transposase-like protein